MRLAQLRAGDIGLSAITTVLVTVFAATEVLAGPVRYGLGSVNLGAVSLAPKYILFLWVIIVGVITWTPRHLLVIGTLAVAFIVGVARVGLVPSLLGLNAVLPFFIGLMVIPLWSGRVYCRRILLATAIGGVFLDTMLNFPWAGTELRLGEFTTPTSKAWMIGSIERLAGFARSSTLAGLQIAALALLVAYDRTVRGRVLWIMLAMAAIALTTSRAALVALLIPIVVTLLPTMQPGHWHRRAAIGFAILGGIMPVLAVGFFSNPHWGLGLGAQTFFSSLEERMYIVWPQAVQGLVDVAFPVLGLGLGSSYSASVSRGATPVVVDNVILYAWTLGGVLLVGALMLVAPWKQRAWASSTYRGLVLGFWAAGVTNNLFESGLFAFAAGAAMTAMTTGPSGGSAWGTAKETWGRRRVC